MDVVIGLEVHAQLLTQTKMYCGCSADVRQCSPKHPRLSRLRGTTGCHAGHEPRRDRTGDPDRPRPQLRDPCLICKLDRKNYVYPDLPKGYQISQYDLPLCVDGSLEFEADGDRCAPASPASISRKTPAAWSTPGLEAAISAWSISTAPGCR